MLRFKGLLAEADLSKDGCRIVGLAQPFAQIKQHVVGGFVALGVPAVFQHAADHADPSSTDGKSRGQD